MPWVCQVGSSPHTRGARLRQSRERQRPGIIPAYAGSTLPSAGARPVGRDHPRIRGEHVTTSLSGSCMSGSSPHTRGALTFADEPVQHVRIIPAYAGSTVEPSEMLTAQKDHPRIRGEHRGGASGTDDIPGSSPHTRGAHSGWPEGSRTPGIIPAYAGSTERGHGDVNRAWDHPRIRGEHGIPKIRATLIVGSSPHTRGAQPSRSRLWTWSRIIPAYAGSTRLPRSMATSRTGSSPHTRGALGSGSVVDPRMRIIPAYAGSTRSTSTAPETSADHPRIRGEHVPWPDADCATVGSSPHTRGARPVHGAGAGRSGIIPAYAGSTPVGRVAEMREAGSSPHTRGAQPLFLAKRRDHRIIPAYAGSTTTSSAPPKAWTDHPRIRGEHSSSPSVKLYT